MSILDRAVAHYKDKIAGKKIEIEVPEWGTKAEPAFLYMRPLSCCSVKIASKLYVHIQKGTVEAAVEVIMMLATNIPEDTGDEHLFRGFDAKKKMMESMDHKVLLKIFEKWVAADEEGEKETKKR